MLAPRGLAMSDDKRKPDPNATIQIDLDALDQVLANPPVSERAVGASVRSAPPPLPPEHRVSNVPASHTLPSVTLPPPASAGKKIVFGALFVLLLVAAIVGGLRVGGVGRGGAVTTPSASTIAPVASAPPSVAPSAVAPSSSENLLVIPPTEIRSQ